MTALRNLLADLAAQFRRPGDRLRRLACVLRFWAHYGSARLGGLDRPQAYLAALKSTASGGATPETATMTLDGGVVAQLDLFCAAYLTREILDEGTYRAPGFVPEEGWTVVDVGAHQGIFTLDTARRVGPTGKVISVEPFPFSRGLLEKNVKANGFDQVTVAPYAAAEAKGPKTFFVTNYASGWQSLVQTGDDRTPIQVNGETLDAILAERGAGKIDLLKVDVEGAWRLVFAGATKTLAARPRLVMEVEGDDAEVAAATARLRELGYAVERRHSILFARPEAG